MDSLRLDRRTHGRIAPSDGLQEAFLDIYRRHTEHRKHRGVRMREPGREVWLHAVPVRRADSMSLANPLLGRLTTPSLAALRVEMHTRIQDVLKMMGPIDREVLVPRHFEERTNNQTAEILGPRKAATSNRHVRALRGFTDILTTMPDFLD